MLSLTFSDCCSQLLSFDIVDVVFEHTQLLSSDTVDVVFELTRLLFLTLMLSLNLPDCRRFQNSKKRDPHADIKKAKITVPQLMNK